MYLHKIGNSRFFNCLLCNGVMDGTDTTFFSCGRWKGIRQQFYALPECRCQRNAEQGSSCCDEAQLVKLPDLKGF